MPLIQFDFFNRSQTELLKSFCDYFRLDKEMVSSYFGNVSPDQLTPEKLTKDLNIDLNYFDSGELSIVCRHMTTASQSDVESFTVRGILNLKQMLQEKTPLSDFLRTYGIVVDVDNRKMHIGEKIYPIKSYGEPCDFCFKGRSTPCNDYFKCEPRKNMEHLGLKLYKYGATLEFFTHATIEEMERYSSIRRCPEILQTLDKITSSINGFGTSSYKMSYDWMKEKKKCYVLEFPVALNTMETFVPIDFDGAWSEIRGCLIQSGYDRSDYFAHRVPQTVFDNMIFLRRFINIYFYDSEELGSLLPELYVKPDKVKVIEVN